MNEIEEFMELYSVEKEIAEQLVNRIKNAIKFKLEAKSELEKEQAKINMEILTQEVPLILKAMVLESTITERLKKALQLFLKIIS